jgi:ATP-binding cassette subfamily B protein
MNRRSRFEQRSWREDVKLFAYIHPTLVLIWQAAPLWLILFLLLLIVQGLLPVATVFLTREVVNQLVAVVDQQTPSVLQSALRPITLLAVVMIVAEVLNATSTYIRMSLAERVRDALTNRIHSHAIALDLRFYDSADYYDVLFRASVDALERPLSLLDSLSSIVQNLITLVAMAGVLTLFAWWLPGLLVIGTLPALWVALKATVDFHRWRRRNTVNERRLTYYQRAMIRDDAAAELRLFGLGPRFEAKYDHLRRKLRDERLALMRKQTWGQLAAGLFGLFSMAVALVYMGRQALQGLVNLGDIVMFYQAMNQGQRLMVIILSKVGEVYRNLVFLEDLFTFLQLEPEIADPPQPTPMNETMQQGIDFQGVTFAYPESDRIALSAFDMHIPAGKTVAIVGENGAGKSTLLKLICRLYDPQAGAVTWDGVDLRQLAVAELRRRITVLFQQPIAYHETVADNIHLGDIGAQPTLAEIEEAARKGGAASIVEKLPKGYDTVLGKWFGYTDLSVGEWQRVALSRAFLRQAELVILDEPTSAMDSWAEHAWMANFRELVAGRTAIIITHRFTTAMQADLIHVMIDGRIVESGSHAELVARGGRYAQSWREQMQEVKPAERSGDQNGQPWRIMPSAL